MSNPIVPNNYERLLAYALWLLSKKRYTCSEISKKLKAFIKRHELIESEASAQVIDRLKELNYLNDRKFAEDYVSDRVRFKPRGKFLLQRELKMKGIDPVVSAATLDNLEVDEFQMAQDLILKRRFNFEGEDAQKQRERAFRFLASKGFNKEIIYKTVKTPYNGF